MASGGFPSTDEVKNDMKEYKKRYPTDRDKLHALLEKKERALADLTVEVKELKERTLEADRTAIIANIEMYSLTPELLAELLAEKFGAPSEKLIPELPEGAQPVTALSDYPEIPEEETNEDEY